MLHPMLLDRLYRRTGLDERILTRGQAVLLEDLMAVDV